MEPAYLSPLVTILRDPPVAGHPLLPAPVLSLPLPGAVLVLLHVTGADTSNR
jgi:hypothetical protein